MSKVYSKAPSGVAERVAHLLKVFHRPLHDAGLRVDLVSVADNDPDNDAPLKLNGYPCAAVVRVIGLKDRSKGAGDVEVVIDEARYIQMNDGEKDALLDHELEHIELQLKKNGRVAIDACGRPKCKMRLHDVQFGWFRSIAERHGIASHECKQATKLYLNHTQTFFAFVGETKALAFEDVRRAGGSIEIRTGDKAIHLPALGKKGRNGNE